jgi:glyoxylase-like metal-dependent hydrolase (beta-lactamase superfamily II)
MKAMPAFYERPGGPKPLAMLRGLGLHIPRSRWSWVPIPAFCVEHPTAGPILVDTGLHEQVATDIGAALGRAAKLLFTIDMRPEWAVPAQLRARGIDPADVRTIVMTHLHYDHASGLSQFPQARVVVDARELEAARGDRIVDGYISRLLDTPGQQWETVPHADAEVDVLGDGTIRLVSTPGHSAGHRSLVLRLGGGREMLLTGDAAYARRTVEGSLLPIFCWDDDAYRRSLAWVQRWVAEHPGMPYVPGHEAAAMDALDAVYA